MELDPTSRIAVAQSTASKAEREAAERETLSQKRVREASEEEEKQLQVQRDQYDKRGEVERARGENYIESVRSRSYENLAELKRRTQTEETRLQRTGDKSLEELDHHYREATADATSRGDTKTREAAKKAYTSEQFERKRGEEQLASLKANYDQQMQEIESTKSASTETYAKQTETQRKANEAKMRTAVQESTDHYNESFEKAVNQNRTALSDLNWRAARDATAIRRDTAVKIDAYAQQKTDPFYQMVKLDASLQENDDQFILRAKIPTHERDRVNVVIRGNELVLSGKRKSEEVYNLGEGRVQRTHAYQTYSESFPMNWPVNPKNMTREWDGDSLIVRIPKRTVMEPPRVKREVAKAVMERPNFPKNLPTESELVAMNTDTVDPNANTPPSKRKPGMAIG